MSVETDFSAIHHYGPRRFGRSRIAARHNFNQPVTAQNTSTNNENTQDTQNTAEASPARFRTRSFDQRHRGLAEPFDASNVEPMQFGDLVDAVNPLHHLPIVGMVYRKVTGDVISPAARIIGGTIYGGPTGLVTQAGNAIIAQHSGHTLEEHALAAVTGRDWPENEPQLASTETEAANNLEAGANQPDREQAASFSPAGEEIIWDNTIEQLASNETETALIAQQAPAEAEQENIAERMLQALDAYRMQMRDRDQLAEDGAPHDGLMDSSQTPDILY